MACHPFPTVKKSFAAAMQFPRMASKSSDTLPSPDGNSRSGWDFTTFAEPCHPKGFKWHHEANARPFLGVIPLMGVCPIIVSSLSSWADRSGGPCLPPVAFFFFWSVILFFT